MKCKTIGHIKMLGKLCLLVGQDMAIKLHKSLILPVLDYADVEYTLIYKMSIKPVINVPE